MDRCALFVDASYVLADGAMAVHGTRRRESVSWDYAGLVQLFGNLAVERTKLPLLRTYWYEATVEGRRSADHDTLADLPGVKLRVAKMRPGRREGVEGEIHRDLTTLARNKAVSDVMVVSAEEDLAQVIADVQDMGMKVTLLQITADGVSASSRALRQECDDILEVSAGHLRPYVELISGAEPARADESDGAVALRTPVNGNGSGHNGNGYNGNAGIGNAGNGAANGNAANGNVSSGSTANGNGRVPAAHAGYAQPENRQGPGQQPPAPARHAAEYQRVTGSAADAGPRPVPQPAAMDSGQPDSGQQEREDAGLATDFAPAGDYAANLDYSASVDYGRPAADHSAVADQGPADYRSALDYGSAADYGNPAEYNSQAQEYQGQDYSKAQEYNQGQEYNQAQDYQAQAGSAPAREDLYAAPVAVSAAADELPGDLDRLSASSRLGADLPTYTPGAVRDQYQRDGGYREAAGGDMSDRLQPVPVPVAVPGGGSAQIRRLPTRNGGPGGPNSGQPPLGLPAAPAQPSMSQPGLAQQSVTQPGLGQPGLTQPGGTQGAQPGLGQPGLGQPGQGQPGQDTPHGQPDGRLADGRLGGGQVSSGQPTGGQPVAPVLPIEPNGMGYGGARGSSYGGPRQVFPGPAGPVGLAGPGGNQGQGPGPGTGGSQPPSAGQALGGPQEAGGQSGPIGLVGPGGYAGGPGVSLGDAVQSAHEEGQAFGESVARDAPALWLEAVLARKPRMPSDLEARLLQGSTLPIDFLLHDEVRHALRRGFWDALERARR